METSAARKAVAVVAGGFTHDRPMRCRVLPMAAPPACRFRSPARAEAISHALHTGLKSSRCQMRLRGRQRGDLLSSVRTGATIAASGQVEVSAP